MHHQSAVRLQELTNATDATMLGQGPVVEHHLAREKLGQLALPWAVVLPRPQRSPGLSVVGTLHHAADRTPLTEQRCCVCVRSGWVRVRRLLELLWPRQLRARLVGEDDDVLRVRVRDQRAVRATKLTLVAVDRLDSARLHWHLPWGPPPSLALAGISIPHSHSFLELLPVAETVGQRGSVRGGLCLPADHLPAQLSVGAKQIPRPLAERLELGHLERLQLLFQWDGQAPPAIQVPGRVTVGSRRVVDEELHHGEELRPLSGPALDHVHHEDAEQLLQFLVDSLDPALLNWTPWRTKLLSHANQRGVLGEQVVAELRATVTTQHARNCP